MNILNMKNIIFIVLIAMLGFACTGEQSTGTDTADSTTATAPAQQQGTAATPMAPAQSGLTASLTKDFWVYEFYIDPKNKENNRNFRGKWFDLKPDGTFQSGHWEEITGNGSWLLLKGEDNKDLLRLDNVNDAEDAEFIVQMNADGDQASWVGTDTYGHAGVMLKAINLMSQPTKQQFGVQ